MTTAVDVEVVDIRKIIGDSNIRAFADIKFAGSLIVKGFSVVKGKNGIFVSMPRKATKDGRWLDVLTPVDDRLRQDIEEKILEAYDLEADGVKN